MSIRQMISDLRNVEQDYEQGVSCVLSHRELNGLLDIAEAAEGVACLCDTVCAESIKPPLVPGGVSFATRTWNQCPKGSLRAVLSQVEAQIPQFHGEEQD